MNRKKMHTKASATAALLSGEHLFIYPGMLRVGPSAAIGMIPVRYTTAMRLIEELGLQRDREASTFAAKKYFLRAGGAA